MFCSNAVCMDCIYSPLILNCRTLSKKLPVSNCLTVLDVHLCSSLSLSSRCVCNVERYITVRKEAAMKYGMRKPSWKKSLSARTKGRATRAVKKALIPGYGKKGMGWLHTKRKLYNTVYKKITFSLFDLFK